MRRTAIKLKVDVNALTTGRRQCGKRATSGKRSARIVRGESLLLSRDFRIVRMVISRLDDTFIIGKFHECGCDVSTAVIVQTGLSIGC